MHSNIPYPASVQSIAHNWFPEIRGLGSLFSPFGVNVGVIIFAGGPSPGLGVPLKKCLNIRNIIIRDFG